MGYSKTEKLSNTQKYARISLRLLFIPILFSYALNNDKGSILTVLACITFSFLLLDTFRYRVEWLGEGFIKLFGPILLQREQDPTEGQITGASYFLLSFTMCLPLFAHPTYITAFSVFIISDLVATIVEIHYGKLPFFDKKLEGVWAFIISGVVITIFIGALLEQSGIYYIGAFVGIVIASVIRGASTILRLNSNFFIPVTIGASIWLLHMMQPSL